MKVLPVKSYNSINIRLQYRKYIIVSLTGWNWYFQPINYFFIFGDENTARIKTNRRLLHVITSLFPPGDINKEPRINLSPSVNIVKYAPPIAIIIII